MRAKEVVEGPGELAVDHEELARDAVGHVGLAIGAVEPDAVGDPAEGATTHDALDELAAGAVRHIVGIAGSAFMLIQNVARQCPAL